MHRHPNPSIALALALLLFHDAGGTLCGQATQAAVPSGQQLDQLLAPIALYPDALLAQITTASTNPQEILDVDNWLHQNSNLSGTDLQNAAQQQGFDPAFIALVTFPQVLDMMAQNIDDYAAIGAAFSANQASVMESIQRLRAQAYASGALQSNAQQQVVKQDQGGQQIIVVQPANPQVVYVPTYDPTVVYAPPPSTGPSTGAVVASTLLTFGAGIAIGALVANNQPWGWGGWGWNWGHRTVIVNHNTWVTRNNYYRPPAYTYRPRPVPYNARPGYGGNWAYRPPNYRPPAAYRPPANAYRAPANTYRPPANTYRPPPSGSYSASNPNRPPPAQPNTNRPPPNTNRPAPTTRPAPTQNAYAGYQPNKGGGNRETGGRANAFSGSSSGQAARNASNRGQESMGRAKKR
ncbi:MAG: DUF3300 domain-containing protein [Acidobacteriaceae bacterium]|nr:DUF3300 domain-containing protein [Acidobacteriaceae bacterium]